MKKFVFTLAICLFAISAFSQQWKAYKIDDSVQVALPPDFKKTDTLGQTLITAKTGFGYIQISKQHDSQHSTPDIEKIKHLNRYYNDFVKRIQASSNSGTISNERDTLLENLRVRDFTLAVDSGSGKQLRNFRLLHENGATYVFQYLFQDIHQEYAAPESTAFFKSIQIIPTINVQSQFTSPENTTGKAPASNSKLYIGIGIATILLILGIFYVLKRKRRD